MGESGKDFKGYLIIFGILGLGIGLVLYMAHSANKESSKQTED